MSKRIVFVYPRFDKFLSKQDAILRDFLRDRSIDAPSVASFVAPPALGIPILISLTPAEYEVRLVDDQLEDATTILDAELVAVSFFTPQASRAYTICDSLRAKGLTVVVGGMHPTALPEEAELHADAVCVGEGETVWTTILQDFAAKRLQKRYRGTPADLDRTPLPKRDAIYAQVGYTWPTDVVQAARGCRITCQHCLIPGMFGQAPRFRSVSRVVEDVRSLRYGRFYLSDDQIFQGDAAYAHQLFRALEGNQKQIFVNTAPSLASSPELLRTMRRAGVEVFYCTLGIDPLSRGALRGNRATVDRVRDLVRRVQDANMIFFASFVVGEDEHGPEIKEQILELCSRTGILLAEFFVVIPIPGVPFHTRLLREKRLLHQDWARYNGAHVVHHPKKMSPDVLQRLYLELWSDFARLGGLTSSTERERFDALRPDAHVARA